MRPVTRRTVARSAVVVLTLALCLLGPVRAVTWLPGYHDASAPTLTPGGAVSSDNAVVERSAASTLMRWAQWLEAAAVVWAGAAGLLWLLSTGGGGGVTPLRLATGWQRRAPPLIRQV